MKADWITDKLVLSGSIDNYQDMHDIDVVINLRAEQHDDIYELTKKCIIYYWIPIADFQSPRSDQIKLFLKLMKKHKDDRVLVHCAVGRGRSAMLVAIYLVYNGHDVDTVEEYIQNKRPSVLLTDMQRHKLKLVKDLNFYETG